MCLHMTCDLPEKHAALVETWEGRHSAHLSGVTTPTNTGVRSSLATALCRNTSARINVGSLIQHSCDTEEKDWLAVVPSLMPPRSASGRMVCSYTS